MSDIILTDGGMGQELLRRSKTPPTPLWSGRVLIDEPELVRELHVDFIRAGARVITINSYAATPERLEREGVGELFEPLQKLALDLAHEAREDARAHRPGSAIATTRRSRSPTRRRTRSTAVVVAQEAERVDLMLCETMASAEEARAAATAAAEGGKPVWVSWTLADDGPPRLRSGETLAAAADALADVRLAARLINCSQPEALAAALPELVALGGTVGV